MLVKTFNPVHISKADFFVHVRQITYSIRECVVLIIRIDMDTYLNRYHSCPVPASMMNWLMMVLETAEMVRIRAVESMVR